MITAKDIIDMLPIVAHRGWRVSMLQNGPMRRAIRDPSGASVLAVLAHEIDEFEPISRDATVGAIRFLRAASAEFEVAQLQQLQEVVSHFAAACDCDDAAEWPAILRALGVHS